MRICRFVLILVMVGATALSSSPSQVLADPNATLTIANFEDWVIHSSTSAKYRTDLATNPAVDPRLDYGGGALPIDGLDADPNKNYGINDNLDTTTNPPTLRQDGTEDDSNSWTMHNNGDSVAQYADVHLTLNAVEDWSDYTTLIINYKLTVTPGPSGGSLTAGMNVWIYDQSAGWQSTGVILGDAVNACNCSNGIRAGTVSLPIGNLDINQVSQLNFRVNETFLSQQLTRSGDTERVDLYSIKISGNPNLAPNAGLWPLPTYGSNQTYWWTYTWTPGGNWSGMAYEGGASATTCPWTGGTTGVTAKTLLVAHYANDGAFGDGPGSTGFNADDLIAIDHYKSHPCAWWQPGRNKVLRWYSKGGVFSHTQIFDDLHPTTGNATSGFLSFRGSVTWNRQPGTITPVRQGQPQTAYQMTGSNFPTDLSQNLRDVWKVTTTAGDNILTPNYPVIPTKLIDAKLIISTQATAPGAVQIPTDTMNCERTLSGLLTWSGVQQSNQLATCAKPQPLPPNAPPNTYTGYGLWLMVMRTTTYSPNGHPVLYVGYSEPGNSNTGIGTIPGACEEWWFEQDVGPLYIVKHPQSTLSDCMNNRLAATKNSGANSAEINNPATYVTNNRSNLTGYLKQDDYCIVTSTVTCNVQ